MATSAPSVSVSSVRVKARARPRVDKDKLATGRLRTTPLAWASRDTISATWTSPACPIGTSTDLVAWAWANPGERRRMIDAHFLHAPCMTNGSPARGTRILDCTLSSFRLTQTGSIRKRR